MLLPTRRTGKRAKRAESCSITIVSVEVERGVAPHPKRILEEGGREGGRGRGGGGGGGGGGRGARERERAREGLALLIGNGDAVL